MLLVLTKSSLAIVPSKDIDAYKEKLSAHLHSLYILKNRKIYNSHVTAAKGIVLKADSYVKENIHVMFRAADAAARAAAAAAAAAVGADKSHEDKVHDAAYVSSIAHAIRAIVLQVDALSVVELNETKGQYRSSKDRTEQARRIIAAMKNNVIASHEGFKIVDDRAKAAERALHAAVRAASDSQVAGAAADAAGE